MPGAAAWTRFIGRSTRRPQRIRRRSTGPRRISTGADPILDMVVASTGIPQDVVVLGLDSGRAAGVHSIGQPGCREDPGGVDEATESRPDRCPKPFVGRQIARALAGYRHHHFDRPLETRTPPDSRRWARITGEGMGGTATDVEVDRSADARNKRRLPIRAVSVVPGCPAPRRGAARQAKPLTTHHAPFRRSTPQPPAPLPSRSRAAPKTMNSWKRPEDE